MIVVGLPFVQKNVPPQLRPQQPDQVACLLQPNMPLLVTGAPLVFSTAYARNLVLHVKRPDGPVDVPLKPDAFNGGLVAQNTDMKAGDTGDTIVTGTVRGDWGFDTFEGPTLNLQQTDSKTFKVVGDTQLTAGKDAKLQLQGDAVGCVQHISLTEGGDKKQDISFQPAGEKDMKKTTLDLSVPMKDAKPGTYALLVQQYGKQGEEKVPLTAYNGAIKLESVKLHAGDSAAVLTGDGVENVASVQIDGQDFTPTEKGDDPNTLHLAGKSGVTPKQGTEATAKLKDGRTFPVKIETEAARPALKLLSMKTEAAPQQGTLPVTLTGKDVVPLQGKLTIVMQSEKPFDRSQSVEVATVSGGVHTNLSIAANTLTLQDEHTAIATLDPQKAFGNSAFGNLQMRPVAADGTTGDWSPVGTLVRTPTISAIQCISTDASAPQNTGTSGCAVHGKDLFLVQSFSGTRDFAKPVEVPSGFSDESFTAPVPLDGTTLYLKLRDDPNDIASVKLPAPVAQPAGAAGTPLHTGGTQPAPLQSAPRP